MTPLLFIFMLCCHMSFFPFFSYRGIDLKQAMKGEERVLHYCSGDKELQKRALKKRKSLLSQTNSRTRDKELVFVICTSTLINRTRVVLRELQGEIQTHILSVLCGVSPVPYFKLRR